MGVASLIVSASSNYGPRWGDPGAVSLARRKLGDLRPTKHYYLSIRSGSCYGPPMFCVVVPVTSVLREQPVDLGLGLGGCTAAISEAPRGGGKPQPGVFNPALEDFREARGMRRLWVQFDIF